MRPYSPSTRGIRPGKRRHSAQLQVLREPSVGFRLPLNRRRWQWWRTRHLVEAHPAIERALSKRQGKRYQTWAREHDDKPVDCKRGPAPSRVIACEGRRANRAGRRRAEANPSHASKAAQAQSCHFGWCRCALPWSRPKGLDGFECRRGRHDRRCHPSDIGPQPTPAARPAMDSETTTIDAFCIIAVLLLLYGFSTLNWTLGID